MLDFLCVRRFKRSADISSSTGDQSTCTATGSPTMWGSMSKTIFQKRQIANSLSMPDASPFCMAPMSSGSGWQAEFFVGLVQSAARWSQSASSLRFAQLRWLVAPRTTERSCVPQPPVFSIVCHASPALHQSIAGSTPMDMWVAH